MEGERWNGVMLEGERWNGGREVEWSEVGGREVEWSEFTEGGREGVGGRERRGKWFHLAVCVCRSFRARDGRACSHSCE